jgi:hypothetical protein
MNRGLKREATSYSPTVAVPSAQAGLTSLFGMGRGGARRYNHLRSFGLLICSAIRRMQIHNILNMLEQKR